MVTQLILAFGRNVPLSVTSGQLSGGRFIQNIGEEHILVLGPAVSIGPKVSMVSPKYIELLESSWYLTRIGNIGLFVLVT